MAWTSANYYGLTMAQALGYAPKLASQVSGSDGSYALPTTGYGITAAQVESWANTGKALIEEALAVRRWVLPLTYTASSNIHLRLQDILAHLVSGRAIIAMGGNQDREVPNDGQRLLWEAIGNVNEPTSIKTCMLGRLAAMQATTASALGLTSSISTVTTSTAEDVDTEVEDPVDVRHDPDLDTSGEARYWL